MSMFSVYFNGFRAQFCLAIQEELCRAYIACYGDKSQPSALLHQWWLVELLLISDIAWLRCTISWTEVVASLPLTFGLPKCWVNTTIVPLYLDTISTPIPDRLQQGAHIVLLSLPFGSFSWKKSLTKAGAAYTVTGGATCKKSARDF